MMSHAGLWPLGRVALALALGCLFSRSAEAQVYRLAELNIDQIRLLDGNEPLSSCPAESWRSTAPICRRSPTAIGTNA